MAHPRAVSAHIRLSTRSISAGYNGARAVSASNRAANKTAGIDAAGEKALIKAQLRGSLAQIKRVAQASRVPKVASVSRAAGASHQPRKHH